MNIEQEARDRLNAVSEERFGYSAFDPIDSRCNHRSVEAVCRALEARNETQAAFDAYRREVSEACKKAIATMVEAGISPHARSIVAHETIARFIIPEPVDPLVQVFRTLPLNGDAGCDKLTDDEWLTVANAARDALAKIGGKVVFEGEGA